MLSTNQWGVRKITEEITKALHGAAAMASIVPYALAAGAVLRVVDKSFDHFKKS
jgi:hypothetical protein